MNKRLMAIAFAMVVAVASAATLFLTNNSDWILVHTRTRTDLV